MGFWKKALVGTGSLAAVEAVGAPAIMDSLAASLAQTGHVQAISGTMNGVAYHGTAVVGGHISAGAALQAGWAGFTSGIGTIASTAIHAVGSVIPAVTGALGFISGHVAGWAAGVSFLAPFAPVLGPAIAGAVAVGAVLAVCGTVKKLFHHKDKEPGLIDQQRQAGNAVTDQKSLNRAMAGAGPSITSQQSYDMAMQNAQMQAQGAGYNLQQSGVQYNDAQYMPVGQQPAKGGLKGLLGSLGR